MTVPTRRPRWLVGLTEYAGVTEYTGGIGTHYASLLPALVRIGYDIDLVIFTDADTDAGADGPDLRDSVIDGVRISTARTGASGMTARAMIARALTFRRIAARQTYDVVFLPEWAAVAAALPSGAPLVTNLATGIRLGDWISGRRNNDFAPLTRFRRAIQDRLETRQIRRSRGVVPISNAVLDWNRTFVQKLPPAAVVRNCVEIEQIRLLATQRRLPEGWPPDDRSGSPIVLFVGRLERRKGVLVAMESFADVLEQYPTARLVLAGASGDRRFEPTKPELLDALGSDHRGQVTFLGHVAAPALFAAMAASDVVICPSLWEGFGNVALEAKAVGTPLVVTTGSGFDDFCSSGDDCLAVEPGEPGALAGAIMQILGSTDVRARLVAGGTMSLEGFAPDAVAAELAAAVEALLRSRASIARR